MPYESTQPRSGSAPLPSGELSSLAHQTLHRLDGVNGRLMRLVERVRGAEPQGVEAERASPHSLLNVLQRCDGQLDAAGSLLDELDKLI